MERKIFLNILLFSLLAVAIAVFFPADRDEIANHQQSLPWQIEPTADGSITVFSLTLEKSPLIKAIQRWDEEAHEIRMFVSPEGKQVVELYFNQTRLAGLRAKIVLTVLLSEEDMQAMFNRGTRISTLGDGSRKVTLHPDDLLTVQQSPIKLITYLPKAKLDAALINSRFGEPAEKIAEKKGSTTHWLYPNKGLDIALDTETGKTVFQYIAPRNFEQVMTPLKQLEDKFN